ncbi:MAG: 3-hydroxyacyl-CoA dehydrogenase family protein [Bacteroidota bacterium]
MQVYHLQNQQYRTLLVGDPRPVAEFAALLQKNNFTFSILNLSVLDAFEGFDPAMFHEFLGKYSEHIIDDLEEGKSFDVIVDLSLTFAPDKAVLLDGIVTTYPQALVLSSTLMCTATELTALLSEPASVIGFNGTPTLISTMTSMEIAPALQTAPEIIELAKAYFSALGFTPEIVEDRVALVMPRILATLVNEAAFAVMEKVASPSDIDTAMKLGVNYPKGLLEWADQIGIEVFCSILEALYQEYKQERYRTCILLKQYLRAGWVGTQSGKGFYEYGNQL